MENKKVTSKHLKPGMKINGVEYGGTHEGFTGFVKSVNASCVTVEMWRKGGIEEKYSAHNMFLIEMSEEEFKDKYNKEAGEVVKKIQNRLNYDEIGFHEMWNGWLSPDPWELAKECRDKKLNVLGYCKDITPKTAMFSGDILDVGVCVEDEDGDKFWCHFRSQDVEYLKRVYARYQEYKKRGKPGDFDPIEIRIEMEEEKANGGGENVKQLTILMSGMGMDAA